MHVWGCRGEYSTRETNGGPSHARAARTPTPSRQQSTSRHSFLSASVFGLSPRCLLCRPTSHVPFFSVPIGIVSQMAAQGEERARGVHWDEAAILQHDSEAGVLYGTQKAGQMLPATSQDALSITQILLATFRVRMPSHTRNYGGSKRVLMTLRRIRGGPVGRWRRR